MDNEALLASVFLDPRDLPLLNQAECKTAKELLKKIWNKIDLKQGDTTSTINTSSSFSEEDTEMIEDEDDSTDLLQLMINQKDAERQLRLEATSSPIEDILNEISKVPNISKDEDILKYWECRKDVHPQLYSLSKIVHAAPMTQGSKKRRVENIEQIASEEMSTGSSSTVILS
ncbi:uncharacterized protein LOC127284036 [Leptopilina boulardi]|uniref:uncharacterized protein LOC127284036 n=1 Tax=Leptopilina boulardi TaxID=63433 RepID=UPI0021F5A358|nr:uncharacterized protein LOC127284036 [Leptopilina boulardi]